MVLITCTACGESFSDAVILRGSVRWREGHAFGVCHRCYSEDIDSILTEREKRFVQCVSCGKSGCEAAALSGYAHPDLGAERLLKSEKIMAALLARRGTR